MLNCCLLNGLVVLAHCAFQSKHALLLFQCTFNGHKATSRPNLSQASGQTLLCKAWAKFADRPWSWCFYVGSLLAGKSTERARQILRSS